MVSFIGNRKSKQGVGLIPPNKVISGGYKTIIGNGFNLFNTSLSFSLGAFTNATSRHLMIKNPGTGLWEMAGPFAGGTLATKVVGGKRYGQFCSAASAENKYSEVFRDAVSNWTNANVTVTDNAAVSPIATTTSDLVYENTSNSYHRLRQPYNTDGSSTYFYSIIVKPKERTFGRLYLGNGFAADPYCFFSFSGSGSKGATAGCNYVDILPLIDDYYYVYLSGTSNAAVAAYMYFHLAEDISTDVYIGDGSSGLYTWGCLLTKSDMIKPYISSTAVPSSVNKDQFAWSEAVVNAHSWVRDGFKFDLIMSHATDEMLADDGNEHVIAAYDTTGAKGVVELYFDGADKKIKLRDDDNGALLESAALDWSLGDQIHCELTLDDGSNSKLVVDGGGVDTSYTGTQTAAADGPLHYGMDDSQALQFDLGQISEPEPL